jgi:uncharacterized membrane protein YgcG
MKKFIYCAAALTLTLGSFAIADQQHQSPIPEHSRELMRMDCRFYAEKHDCVASATYVVKDHHAISDISYGVSCDRQTLYNNGGTYMPQEQVSDGIRPWTSAVPRVELTPQFALRNPGTYTSKLETGDDQFMNGVCYVNRLPSHDDESSGSDSSSGSSSDDGSSSSDNGSGSNSSSGSGSGPAPIPSPLAG